MMKKFLTVCTMLAGIAGMACADNLEGFKYGSEEALFIFTVIIRFKSFMSFLISFISIVFEDASVKESDNSILCISSIALVSVLAN